MAKQPEIVTKKVMLVTDHVFLPIDLNNPDWASTSDTRRYDGKVIDEKGELKRARLDMHPDLADFLVSRDQAELL